MRITARLITVAAAAALLLGLVAAPALADPPTPASGYTWSSMFADEFSAGSVNTTTWKQLTPWNTHYTTNEAQYYDNSAFSFPTSGEMRITTSATPINGYAYKSGIVTSQQRYSYGYYETRAKLPKGRGVWPAFWLTNDSTLEIDTFEVLGQDPYKVYMTLHMGGRQIYQGQYSGFDTSAGYHTYGVDWQPTYVRWYIDGVKRAEYVGSIPPDPMNIIANTAVGTSLTWPGPTDSTTVMPQYYDIDYIRAYKSVTAPTVPTNTAPVGAADAYSTPAGVALSVPARGVLANDTDADGNALTARLVSAPAHGTLALNADGSFLYTPAAGYEGADSFTYQDYDGTALSAATPVSINVTHVNRAPVAVADSYSTSAGTALSVPARGVLANDTDADGNLLTARLVGAPAHGTVALNADGSFLYTPAAGYEGVDSFTYQAYDGTTLSAVTSVSINVTHVNAAPIAAADAYTTAQDKTLTIATPGVLSNDIDAEGSSLTAQLVSAPSHGTLSLAANGSFVYTPAAGYSGSDSFSYRAFDGAAYSGTVTVALTVTPVVVTPPPVVTPPTNSAPTAVDDVYGTRADRALTVYAPGVLANDTDVDGNALTAQLLSAPTHGTVALAADGSFVYTADPTWYGTDTFTYCASDGQAVSNLGTVSINVTKSPRRRGNIKFLASTTLTQITR